jgi:hypothetical protein
MTTATTWRIQGDVMEACNCNITCPCNFGGDPTEIPCEAILGLRIREGSYGNTRLDALSVVLMVRMPGKVFDGGWTLGAYLDQKANQEQVGALGAILSGEAGGMFAALSGLVGNPLPPKQVPITFTTANGEHQISVPGLLEVGSERIPDPMGGEPLDTKATGLSVPFYTGPASIRRSKMLKLSDPDMSFEHTGGSSLIGQFDFAGP